MDKLKSHLEAAARRLLDILASAAGILFFAPLGFFVVLFLRRDSPGPIFFKGRRVGKNGREFDILKFRTMYDTPESFNGPKLTAHDDPRVTPFGAWLRATKVNELPQLWNVLIGDMSLVGPRPEDPVFVAKWPVDVRKVLLSVRPGITSPASVIYRDLELLLRSDRVVDEYLQNILPTKMRYDTLYVRNRTLLMDIDILFWTLIALLPRMRNHPVRESRLFWGPLSSFMSNDLRWFSIDFLVALASVAVVGGVWRSVTPLHIGWFWAPLIALAMALLFGAANSLMGLNKIFWSKARPSDAIELAVSTTLAVGILLLVDGLLIRQPNVPVGLYIFGGVVSFLGFLTVRYRERLITGAAGRWLRYRAGRHALGERVLIVGAGELGEFAAWLVRKGDLTRAFQIIGMVDDDPRKQGMRIDGIRVLGTTDELEALVKSMDIGVVLFAISNISAPNRERIIRVLDRSPAKIVLVPNVVEMMRGYFSMDQPSWLTVSGDGVLSRQLMDAWLIEVEQLLSRGDLESAQEQIHRLRLDILRSRDNAEIYDRVLAE